MSDIKNDHFFKNDFFIWFYLGARSGKHWFVVKDITTRVHKMLTITPKGHHMPFVTNSTNRNILTRIFSMLKVWLILRI